PSLPARCAGRHPGGAHGHWAAAPAFSAQRGIQALA
nr:hypothetical protein [Tanacetum cinerariifolium]